MKWLKAIAKELLGLFVDDGSFAVAIVAWLGAVWLLSTHVLLKTHWSSVVLFAGLVLILVESAVRRARQ